MFFICTSGIVRCSAEIRKSWKLAPAVNLDPKIRSGLANAAVALARESKYYSAATVEFLVDADTGEYYFIEVNPRVQVEHTVTEMVTGIDIVQSQIQIAQGFESAWSGNESAATE